MKFLLLAIMMKVKGNKEARIYGTASAEQVSRQLAATVTCK
jgi:hypothetical protein